MAIDKALEEIEGTVGIQIETSKAKNQSSEIFSKAREIILPVLIDFYSCKLNGQQQPSVLIDEIGLEVIKQYGFEDFIIYPRKMSDGSRSLVTKFNLNADLIKNILKKKYGEYILETDVANLIPSKKSEKVDDLCKTLPEFKKFYDNLFSNEILNERRATFNPYILAMNMEVKYRPLAVLAIEDMFKTKNFEVINRHRFSIHVLVRFIQEYSPQINSYLKVAKEYQIKEILPIKNDFEKVCDIYSGVWNGSN